MKQLNSILDGVTMGYYLLTIRDSDFELLSYDVMVYEEFEVNEDYLSHIAENIDGIFHMDGYNKDCFDNNDEMALDGEKRMIFLGLHLQVFLYHPSWMDFHFLHAE